MRSTATMLLLLCALVAAGFSFLSDDGFARLSALTRRLDHQQLANARLSDAVQTLRREVQGLQVDPRAVEKAARTELGMARPDELVIIFEKKDKDKDSGEKE